MTRIIAESTFCLNLDKATPDSYQNWVTVRLWSNGLVERKCNEGGNGQSWVAMGYAERGEYTLCNAKETQSRMFATIVRRLGGSIGGSYGAAFCKAVRLRPTVNEATGRKLTAAPSIREGRPPRDKNVNQMRAKVARIDMAAAMAARLARK